MKEYLKPDQIVHMLIIKYLAKDLIFKNALF